MKLIKLSASWCQPCKMLSSTLSAIDHPLISSMSEVDIDASPDVVKHYGVRGVPTMILVDDQGSEIRRVSGSLSKEKIISFLDGQ